MKPTFAFRSWLDSCLDWVVPPRCGGCGTYSSAPFCGLCRQSLIPSQAADLRLPAFKRRGRLADSIFAPFQYGGELAHAIGRLKYSRLSHVATPLEALLAAELADRPYNIDLVIPVPLHRRRLRKRGFNQAALLAAPLARRLGRSLCCDALFRVVDTTSQTRLNGRQRQENMAGAFRARRKLVEGKRVLLVDDVMTTGATLAACSESLRAAGAAEVHLLALGVTAP